MMNFCEQCGNKLNEGAKFCGKCGTAVPALQTETQRADKSANAETKAQKAYNEGLACKEAERYDEAIVHFTEALGLCHEADQNLYCDILFERGAMYVLKGLSNPGIADLTKVIQIDPNNYGAYYVRGLAYSDNNQNGFAIPDFNKAIRLSPNDDDFYRSRGIAYSSEGNSEAAIADFTKSLQIEPDDARTYGYRGIEYVKIGDIAKAKADVVQGVQIDPENEKLAQLVDIIEEAERQGGTVSAPGFCAQCGTRLEEGEMFCPNCGAKAGEVSKNQPAQQDNFNENNIAQFNLNSSYVIKEQVGTMGTDVGSLYLYDDRLEWKGSEYVIFPFNDIFSVMKTGDGYYLQIKMISNRNMEYNFVPGVTSKMSGIQGFFNGLMGSLNNAQADVDSWYTAIMTALGIYKKGR